MVMPNFLIIGAAKSGTTALYRYLKQHPDIYMSPRKEPHFFSFGDQDPRTQGPGDTIPLAITSLEDYRSLFQGVSGQIAVGEASPTYLYVPRACERIRQYLPDAKLIAVLRHPAERAFSAYMHVVRDGREPLTDFGQALEAEETRIRQNWGPIWHYRAGGLYYEQLKRYYDSFDHDQIRVYLHDDLSADPVSLLQKICCFLGVAEDFVIDVSVKPNVSGIPRSPALQRVLYRLLIQPNPVKSVSRRLISEQARWKFTTLVRNMNLSRAQLPSDIRRQLVSGYRSDILRLQDLIQRDLSNWLN